MPVPAGGFTSSCGLPDFLAWPLPRPFEGDERVPGGGARLRPQLEEIFHLQAAASQQADHVAVAEVELHRLIIWPFEPVHPEVRPQQPLRGRLDDLFQGVSGVYALLR